MLTLIDGNSLLFRAYYGVHARLTRRDGKPTGAVYGFLNMILPVLGAAKPDDCFVCVFDASRQTFRQEIYHAYKQNRDETPADLITQSELIRIGLHAMGVSVLCIPGVEADDVIATIATQNCNNHQHRLQLYFAWRRQLYNQCNARQRRYGQCAVARN